LLLRRIGLKHLSTLEYRCIPVRRKPTSKILLHYVKVRLRLYDLEVHVTFAKPVCIISYI